MGLRFFAFPGLLQFPFLALNVSAVEENPAACDCQTAKLANEEIAGGCPDPVKQEHCSLYRETIKWKEQLQMEQDRRQLEKRMEPRYAPR
jgi:hypothetical protein